MTDFQLITCLHVWATWSTDAKMDRRGRTKISVKQRCVHCKAKQTVVIDAQSEQQQEPPK